jgi:hypothetical protein
MEEKRSTVSGVIQCFRFREKRGMDSTPFRKGKGECKAAIVPAWRGDWRMQRRDDVWIDLRWKTISRASWAERLFGSNTIVEIKYVAKMEWVGKESVTPPTTTTIGWEALPCYKTIINKGNRNIGINLNDQSKRKQLPTFNLNQTSITKL